MAHSGITGNYQLTKYVQWNDYERRKLLIIICTTNKEDGLFVYNNAFIKFVYSKKQNKQRRQPCSKLSKSTARVASPFLSTRTLS